MPQHQKPHEVAPFFHFHFHLEVGPPFWIRHLFLVDDLNGSHLPVTTSQLPYITFAFPNFLTNARRIGAPGALIFCFHDFAIGAFA